MFPRHSWSSDQIWGAGEAIGNHLPKKNPCLDWGRLFDCKVWSDSFDGGPEGEKDCTYGGGFNQSPRNLCRASSRIGYNGAQVRRHREGRDKV